MESPTRKDSSPSSSRVFLLDVDNTLLDNDRVIEDLRGYLTEEVDADFSRQYFETLEELRRELGYADYLGALQRCREAHPHSPHMLAVSRYLLHYPFEERLFPRALEVVGRLSRRAPTVILTDGDVVFQPLKVERAGLCEAVSGRVLVYIHKERELADVKRRFPAERYVLVDDKIRILTAVKTIWGARVTTVFPRQGHYAHDPEVASYPAPDVSIERIGDLLDLDLDALGRAGEA